MSDSKADATKDNKEVPISAPIIKKNITLKNTIMIQKRPETLQIRNAGGATFERPGNVTKLVELSYKKITNNITETDTKPASKNYDDINNQIKKMTQKMK